VAEEISAAGGRVDRASVDALDGTLLGRLPTPAEVADFAAFPDRAGAMTGAIVNLPCGSLVD
jgi:3-oxoacyl-[acyl-carrier protein] reductase